MKTPIAYKAKENDVIVFDKPFNMNGFVYNAIVQTEDGSLVMFDHDNYHIFPREEKE